MITAPRPPEKRRRALRNVEWCRQHVVPWFSLDRLFGLMRSPWGTNPIPAGHPPCADPAHSASEDQEGADHPAHRNQRQHTDMRVAITATVGLLMILSGVIVILLGASPAKDYEALGPRGDFVGGVAGPMIGAGGALLFFATLILQWKELRLQRQEFRRSINVADAQRRELAEQNRLQKERGHEAWIISLSEATRQTQPAFRRPLIRLGIDRLVREAERDLRNGMELFRLFHAACPRGDEQLYDDALDECLATNRPRYQIDRDPKQLSRMDYWFKSARDIVHHKEPSVYDEKGLLVL